MGLGLNKTRQILTPVMTLESPKNIAEVSIDLAKPVDH